MFWLSKNDFLLDKYVNFLFICFTLVFYQWEYLFIKVQNCKPQGPHHMEITLFTIQLLSPLSMFSFFLKIKNKPNQKHLLGFYEPWPLPFAPIPIFIWYIFFIFNLFVNIVIKLLINFLINYMHKLDNT